MSAHVATERGRARTRWLVEKYLRRGLRCAVCGHTAEESAPARGDFGPGVRPRLLETLPGEVDLVADCPVCAGLMFGFSPDKEAGRAPDVVERIEGNALLNEGIQVLLELGCDIGANTAYSNAAAQLGVGNSNTAADASQTDLQGGSTAWAGMAVSYPSRSSQTISWRSEFGSGVANFAWEEYSVRNGASADKNLNRKVESKGTKASGETWTLTLQITIT